MSLLETSGLSVNIGGKPICRDLDLQIQRGECWGILGANGIGKTTLLHTLAGLRKPDKGVVRINNVLLGTYNKKELARYIGVLFQDSQDSFPVTVMETVITGRYPHIPFWAFESANDLRLAKQALIDVGLDEMAERQSSTLSGGERRRLALATLFTQAPMIYLMDEPANHLDLHHQITLLEMTVQRVLSVKGAMMMVLHDINLLTRFCSHAMLIMDAENQLLGSVDKVINTENLKSVYRHRIDKVTSEGKQYYFPA